jgi:hypothetical protein
MEASDYGTTDQILFRSGPHRKDHFFIRYGDKGRGLDPIHRTFISAEYFGRRDWEQSLYCLLL